MYSFGLLLLYSIIFVSCSYECSFSLLNSTLFCDYPTTYSFHCSALGQFLVLAINSVIINTLVHVSWWTSVCISDGHMYTSEWNCWILGQCFSNCPVHINHLGVLLECTFCFNRFGMGPAFLTSLREFQLYWFWTTLWVARS